MRSEAQHPQQRLSIATHFRVTESAVWTPLSSLCPRRPFFVRQLRTHGEEFHGSGCFAGPWYMKKGNDVPRREPPETLGEGQMAAAGSSDRALRSAATGH